jgi:hypothetical protein
MFPDADDLFSEELAVLVMSVTITQTKLRNLLPRLITRIAAECEPKTKSMPKYCMIKRAACATIRSFGGRVKGALSPVCTLCQPLVFQTPQGDR